MVGYKGRMVVRDLHDLAKELSKNDSQIYAGTGGANKFTVIGSTVHSAGCDLVLALENDTNLTFTDIAIKIGFNRTLHSDETYEQWKSTEHFAKTQLPKIISGTTQTFIVRLPLNNLAYLEHLSYEIESANHSLSSK